MPLMPMSSHDLSAWTHSHRFDAGNLAAERGTRLVMAITALTMVLEIDRFPKQFLRKYADAP